ncbi:hypothetical protein CW745_05990 [Psychromonas sp. psych-6C06]|uniref:hypothetical protein n=1 Tax=Psychromonas sp. psych-6C06 TaxID=2058089 RepID=UPI000C3312EB|nr:hypothetical protein [Psychromonas sp. psych-6C06]PKF62974.1 hypothetical protein CW745_05990 [Psychromonas sp. psych-6C06]
MKLSYLLFTTLLCLTLTLAIFSFALNDPFHLLSCNVGCVLLLGLLFGASLFAFDDYCREKQGNLCTMAAMTRKILNYL